MDCRLQAWKGNSNQYANLQLVLASFNRDALFRNHPFIAFSIFINAEIQLGRGGELSPWQNPLDCSYIQSPVACPCGSITTPSGGLVSACAYVCASDVQHLISY